MTAVKRWGGDQQWGSAILLVAISAAWLIEHLQHQAARTGAGAGLAIVFAVLVVAVTTWAVFSGRLRRLLAQLAWPQRVWSLALVGLAVYGLSAIAQDRANLPGQPRVDHVTLLVKWLGILVAWLFLTVMLTPVQAPSPVLTRRCNQIGTGILIGVVIPLLLLEGGLRLYFGLLGTDAQRIIYTQPMQDIQDYGYRFVGSPYINYGLAPDQLDNNDLGYRGPAIAVPKPAGTYRIVALGGSTTYGPLADWRDAYPHQLERLLREQYGYGAVEVVNAGVLSYTTYDSLANLAFHVLDLDPDLIIVYHATNDVTVRMVDPAYYTGLNPVRGIWRAGYSGSPLTASALYRFVAIRLGWMPDPSALDTWVRPLEPVGLCGLFEADYCAQLDMRPEDVLAQNPPIYFARNLRNLVAIAQANGVDVLLSSWAYYPEALPGQANYMTFPFRQQAVAEHNAIIRQVAAEREALFYDLLAALPDDPALWLDGRHLTPAGTHEQAAQYAAFIAEAGLLPATAGAQASQ